MSEYSYIDFSYLNESHLDMKIMISGRIHNIRDQKRIGFLILRKNITTLQCILIKKTLDNKYKQLVEIPNESYVFLYGKLNKLPNDVDKIKSCSYENFEFVIDDFKLEGKSFGVPFSLDDANDLNSENSERNPVLQSTRLDNRSFELRTPINHCIFKLQSNVCQLFRDYLNKMEFIEIHTPKIIESASEGGAQVFPIKYFDKNAYLAQSPQLYKQMCINSDFDKVYEIGHVYRAEKTHSHRHLCEFVGLDVEYAITPTKSYTEIFDILWGLLYHIIESIKETKEYTYIKNNYKFTEINIPESPIIIDFKEGVQLLNNSGHIQSLKDDLSNENEKILGEIIKNKYNTDMFILDKYPTNIRPFYTMPNEIDKNYSNSYDVILRGEEICSGSQRIHDYQQLFDNIKEKNINHELLKNYLNSFISGSKPHCGFGLGLERITMLILNLKNVRKTSLYPRDPNRLYP